MQLLQVVNESGHLRDADNCLIMQKFDFKVEHLVLLCN